MVVMKVYDEMERLNLQGTTISILSGSGDPEPICQWRRAKTKY